MEKIITKEVVKVVFDAIGEMITKIIDLAEEKEENQNENNDKSR